MKIFTSNDFDTGYWTGTAAVVVAENHEEAWKALARELEGWDTPARRSKVIHSSFNLREVDLSNPQVIILQDGDY